MSFHSTFTDGQVHTPLAFTFADSTARASATNPNTGDAYTSTDLYKFARQSDDNSLWLLIATTPSWVEIGSSVDVDTIYTADGTLSGDRVVSGFLTNSLTFEKYNSTTSSNYTLRTEVALTSTSVSLLAGLGDGFGADVATQSISLSASAITVTDDVNSRGIIYAADYSSAFTDRSLVDKGYVDGSRSIAADQDLYLSGNDRIYYDGANDTTNNILTLHGDGSHSLFDPFITLHEGFATANGTDTQDLIINYGKAVKLQFNDGTRSSDVFYTRSIVNASQVFQHMETSFQSTRHDYIDIDQWDWYFDTSGSTNTWTVYDDDAGTTAVLTLDDSGNLSVSGDIKAAGETLVYPFASQITGAATNQTVTTSVQVITLDNTQIDGSGGEYTINLASNRIDMDTADGAKVYEISWTARYLLDGQGTGGATRSYAEITTRLDGTDVTYSRQWTYIREYQGGTNGIPNAGAAGSFLIQPALDDELDFVVQGITEGGETLTDFELQSFYVTIKRVA